LSRGAASVVFVEHQRAAVNALRALLSDWQASGATVVCDEAQHYLAARRAPGPQPDAGRGFDLVFLDPPYASGELPAAAAALARGGLAPEARIYLEQHADDELQPALPSSWRELRTGKAGEVRYHLYAAE
jgi:16S rRNA (guanine966-N2)-methyltransferase